MSTADRLAAALAGVGTEHVFGMPGSQNADFYGALPGHSIRPVLASQELAASFMANGYARVSGRVGVLATIPGPGFTYAIPGLAEARLDSVPLIHITSTPRTSPGRRFQHQAIDQAGILRPLVKDIVELSEDDDFQWGIERAMALALDGEPGPVLVHVGSNRAKDGSGSPPGREAGEGQAESEWWPELRSRLEKARRPVLFLGAGAARSASAIRELLERLPAPVFATTSGRGILGEDDPRSLGFDSERGRVEELNRLLESADLILALGCKMSHNGTAGFQLRLPESALVHVNTDRAALGANYPTSLGIESSVETLLATALADESWTCASEWTDEALAEWKERIEAPSPSLSPEPRMQGVPGGSAESFFGHLRAALPPDGVLVTDSGLHQVLTRRHFRALQPTSLITPADFQSMGFGVPAAIGARLGAPNRPVVALVGDGGFIITATELLTARRERAPIVTVVFNDGYLNLIRLQQVRGDGRAVATSLLNPRMDLLASSLGVRHLLVDGDPEATLAEAIRSKEPVIVEVRMADSAGIRSDRIKGGAKRLARNALPKGMIDRIKSLLGR